MISRARSAAALSLTLAMMGCGERASSTPSPRSPYRGAVLVVIDTVRADHLSCYGHTRPTSPCIDQLAQDGALFRAGDELRPVDAARRRRDPRRRLPSARERGGRPIQSSVVESIAAAGFATAAITEGAYVSRAFGMDKGFKTWVEEEGAVTLPGPGSRRTPRPRRHREHLHAREAVAERAPEGPLLPARPHLRATRALHQS
jgi:hypothetical protein